MNIQELFSNRTQEALNQSFRMAIDKNNQAVDTEHILWGLMSDEIVMKRIFKELGVNTTELKTYIENQIPTGRFTGNQPFITPRANQVIQLAHQESMNLGHNYIGTEHLFLGLILEQEGLAAQIIKKY